MSSADYEYLKLLRRIDRHGEVRADRTGTGTKSVFGHQMRFDLQEGFPLLTTKRIFTRGVFAELLWILSGSTNIQPLLDQDVHIWDEWADENGELGPVYGAQWRDFSTNENGARGSGVDQIANVIEQIKKDPFSRRHIVTAWHPGDLEYMALPPCHMMFQFYVHADEHGNPAELSCHLYQRSGDVFLGVPFNIASYALLTEMMAQVTGLRAREFVHTLGDAHIYLNHMSQVAEQASRIPRRPPTLMLKRRSNIFDYKLEDIAIEGYNPHPAIKGEVSV